MPATVINHILGGGAFQSRLFKEVREKRGLAYSVWTSLAPSDHSALLLGGTSTKNERAAEALAVIREQIASLTSEGPSEEEIEKAKKYLIGSYPQRFDTSTKNAGQLVQMQLEQLGIDYVDRRNGLIDAVTLEDAKRAAKRLAEGGMFVTVVGRAKQIGTKDSGG